MFNLGQSFGIVEALESRRLFVVALGAGGFSRNPHACCDRGFVALP